MSDGQAFNPLELLARLDWSENDDLEFKSARGGIPRSLWETYSAMANSQGGGVVVEKYRDRFEFSNPGTLLVSFDQLLRGNVSECRNKALQTMFTLIGAAEKAGSDVDKIRRGWESQHWRMPIIQEQTQPDRVLWRLPMVSLIPDESLSRLQARFGRVFAGFSKLEVQALVTADLEGTVDNVRMRQITGGHASDMTRLLQGLVVKAALVQKGQGRWTRYQLPEITADSIHKKSDSIHKECDSVHKEGDSVHKNRDSVHSDETWAHLQTIAAPARVNKRVNPQDMERLILLLCRGIWLTRRELGVLLQRNEEGLRSRFLTPMVEHGLLVLRFPDKPNRGDQAYTAGEQALKTDADVFD